MVATSQVNSFPIGLQFKIKFPFSFIVLNEILGAEEDLSGVSLHLKSLSDHLFSTIVTNKRQNFLLFFTSFLPSNGSNRPPPSRDPPPVSSPLLRWCLCQSFVGSYSNSVSTLSWWSGPSAIHHSPAISSNKNGQNPWLRQGRCNIVACETENYISREVVHLYF